MVVIAHAAPASAVDDDTWNSSVNLVFSLKGRDMIDTDGDYRLSFDQQSTWESHCQGNSNVLAVTLYDASGWWHRSMGTRNYPKDCVKRWHSWFTASGGHLMYYKFVNRNPGRAKGPVQSRDA